MKKAVLTRSISLSLLLAGCVEPYYPPGGSGIGDQLVIDGFINATNKSATVKLTRSIRLSETHPVPLESNATVVIKSSSGVEHVLKEGKAGTYQATNMVLNPSDHYKLHVTTAAGNSYSSNEIQMLDSPELDSVSWRPTVSGINFYISAHDPDNKTRYYRWTFVETFEYNVQLVSYFKKVNSVPVPRNGDDYVFSCWSTSNSTNIMVGSTKRLTNDVVNMLPIYFVPKGSRKLSHHYRLRVQQRAISEEEYDFWDLLKKTTESSGGLFDPIPSQVLGNIHSDEDANDKVLGYFSGGYVDEITRDVAFLELPGDLRIVDAYDFDCTGRMVFMNQLNTVLPSEIYLTSFGTPVVQGYIVADEKCADCRSLYNGTNVKPDDWPIF